MLRFSVLLVAFVDTASLAQSSPPVSASIYALLDQGSRLTTQQAAELETKLETNPNDLDSRIRLIGYHDGIGSNLLGVFFEPTDHRSRHIIWFIRNDPGHPVLGRREARIRHKSDPGFVEAGTIWREIIQRPDCTTEILSNAAKFFTFSDRKLAEELLVRAVDENATNPELLMDLGRQFERNTTDPWRNPDKSRLLRAMTCFERALALEPKEDRYLVLDDLTQICVLADQFDKAKAYATEYLKLAPQLTPLHWAYGDAIHKGNLALGHCALNDGNLELAEHYLIQAGRTPGGPGLNSFGPNMLLAQKLLERGRKSAVIDYLSSCGKFWNRAQTDAWTAQIEKGQVPDFGANLRY